MTPKGEQAWRGCVEGQIGHELRGENGFGYDPLFLPLQASPRSMAELNPEEKDAISHRGQALLGLEKRVMELCD